MVVPSLVHRVGKLLLWPIVWLDLGINHRFGHRRYWRLCDLVWDIELDQVP